MARVALSVVASSLWLGYAAPSAYVNKMKGMMSMVTTCDNLKTNYRQNTCCGSSSKEVNLQIVPGPKITLDGPTNPCHGKKPTGPGWDNHNCTHPIDDVVQAVEQAGGDVTYGFIGGKNVTDFHGVALKPITNEYFKNSMCPVNVHWHLGAEHRSAGEFDENGKGPGKAGTPSNQDNYTRRLADNIRYGYACSKYNANDAKFTTEYNWQHCVGMYVGETYEIHWPHSALGACHTPNQFQTPFYDGVFCGYNPLTLNLTASIVAGAVGVQSQVFTIVNDEAYYYPDLIRGMIVDGDFGKHITAYTGSTTGTSRNNDECSRYGPITWQVDRKCHIISASSFDKLCADMKQQRDDMSGDLYAHGARELVAHHLTANNQVFDATR